jgi:hypothetical protein
MSFNKFEHRSPSHQNAVDLFKGKWASDLSEVSAVTESGPHKLFTSNVAASAAQHLGSGGRFDGMKVLELGPLEGAQTYQLEQMGARSIVAIEANAEAFLKCLVVKEVASLRNAQFFLGDFVEYLAHCKERFDLVFASGVLYHMRDPINLIHLIASVTDRCFVWTHHYDAAHPGAAAMKPKVVTSHGVEATYYQFDYPDMNYDKFFGGNKPTTSWMERGTILNTFRHVGFDQITVLSEQADNPSGPWFSFVAKRSVPQPT